jgi:hypothetical protein
MKQERADRAKSEERDKRSRIRIATEQAAIRRQLCEWVSMVGEDGLDAAMRQARKRHHPDVGGNHDDFVTLTKRTEWMQKELRKGQFGFLAI